MKVWIELDSEDPFHAKILRDLFAGGGRAAGTTALTPLGSAVVERLTEAGGWLTNDEVFDGLDVASPRGRGAVWRHLSHAGVIVERRFEGGTKEYRIVESSEDDG